MYANIYVIRYNALLHRVSILHASVFYCYNSAIFTNFTRGFKEEIINEHFYIQGGEERFGNIILNINNVCYLQRILKMSLSLCVVVPLR